jgi:hypothetical protein
VPYQREDLLTASEVARYVYCRRAWWYDRRQLRVRRRSGFARRRASLRLRLLAALAVLALLSATFSGTLYFLQVVGAL